MAPSRRLCTAQYIAAHKRCNAQPHISPLKPLPPLVAQVLEEGVHDNCKLGVSPQGDLQTMRCQRPSFTTVSTEPGLRGAAVDAHDRKPAYKHQRR